MHNDYLDLCMVMYVTADQELDAHTQAASEIFGVPMAEVTPAQRELAKNRNFARCYGMAAVFGKCYGGHKTESPLVARNFFTQAEATRVTKAYFTKHPWMRAFCDQFSQGGEQ
jgi:DNA polymerase-1